MEPTLPPTSEMRIFSELSLAVENGNFVPRQLHIRIVRPASAFRGDPLYVFGWILDIAGFAVDTVLRVDDKTRVRAICLIRIDDFVDASWAVEARGFPKPGQSVTDGDGRIMQPEMDGLILFVIGV